jgi:diadenosine tetraphosphate (Ap4A) HIT family hydrolase
VTDCPFCVRIAMGDGVLAENELAVALRYQYPVSEGHTLVVPWMLASRAPHWNACPGASSEADS